MECGKLTAKLRDAVPVCFIVNGIEIKRLKNIEIPDEIKKLPYTAYKFDVPQNGAITFKIMFEAGVLPAEWPETRQRKKRSPKAKEPMQFDSDALKALADYVHTGETETPEIVPAEELEPETMEVAYGHTGERRKEMVKAISEYLGQPAIYQNAPTFSYKIGDFTVDKAGTVSGPNDHGLITWLHDEGFGE